MKKLEPKNDRVLVKPIQLQETQYGNIIIPDLGKERPELGEVVAVGPGRLSEFNHFIRVNSKVGDKVLVPKIGTIRVEFEGEEYYLVQDREILATIIEQTNE